MRFPPALLVLTVFAFAVGHVDASRRSHSAAAQEAQALHRIRLAAKEKKAWREHLAKLRALPHADRIAEKRHERLWQRKHDEKVAAKAAAKAPEKITRRRRHGKDLAATNLVASARTASKAASGHLRRLAAQAAARRENAARRASVAQARASRLTASRQQRSAQAVAQHRARLAAALAAQRARLAAHDARGAAHLAAGRARWVALHGDGSGGKNIRLWQTGAAGVAVKVISVDLNDPNVKVSAVMAARGNGTSEPFRQMIRRANPNVAVTGTFFSLDDLQPVGDIVIDGSLVHFGGMGTALCITPGNRAEMVHCQWGRHHDWSPFDFVVACGPRLLRRGRVVLDPRAERFHDRHMLAPNSRIAVGITPGNTLFFVMTHTPISLSRLARAMQALGASDAMNLDAGTSTGFYYNGATLAKPGRRLTNMIVVYGRRDRYERALSQLAPAYSHRTASLVRP